MELRSPIQSIQTRRHVQLLHLTKLVRCLLFRAFIGAVCWRPHLALSPLGRSWIGEECQPQQHMGLRTGWRCLSAVSSPPP
jgi:hypothetical protein